MLQELRITRVLQEIKTKNLNKKLKNRKKKKKELLFFNRTQLLCGQGSSRCISWEHTANILILMALTSYQKPNRGQRCWPSVTQLPETPPSLQNHNLQKKSPHVPKFLVKNNFPSPVNEQGPPSWLSGKESACSAADTGNGFDPWVGQVPWRRAWRPAPVFLPGESHGQRGLAGYTPPGCKESDRTSWRNRKQSQSLV